MVMVMLSPIRETCDFFLLLPAADAPAVASVVIVVVVVVTVTCDADEVTDAAVAPDPPFDQKGEELFLLIQFPFKLPDTDLTDEIDDWR